MAIFTTLRGEIHNSIKPNYHTKCGKNCHKILSVWFATGTLEIFATLVYVFTILVVIYDMSMAIIPTLSTSILFCNLCYILL